MRPSGVGLRRARTLLGVCDRRDLALAEAACPSRACAAPKAGLRGCLSHVLASLTTGRYRGTDTGRQAASFLPCVRDRDPKGGDPAWGLRRRSWAAIEPGPVGGRPLSFSDVRCSTAPFAPCRSRLAFRAPHASRAKAEEQRSEDEVLDGCDAGAADRPLDRGTSPIFTARPSYGSSIVVVPPTYQGSDNTGGGYAMPFPSPQVGQQRLLEMLETGGVEQPPPSSDTAGVHLLRPDLLGRCGRAERGGAAGVRPACRSRAGRRGAAAAELARCSG